MTMRIPQGPHPSTRTLAALLARLRLPFAWATLCCAVVLAFSCIGLRAQTAATTGMGHPIELTQARWLYHPGDQPEWKNPAFDDSNWPGFIPQVESPRAFQCVGFCWYRLRVTVPKDTRNLSLGLDNIDTDYQLFVNGELIGAQGRMPPHPSNFMSNLTLYPIPNAAVSTRELSIALRLWTTTTRFREETEGGLQFSSRVELGDTAVLELSREQEYANRFARAAGDMPIGLLAMLVGITSLLLYRTQREHREYLWLFVMATIQALASLFAAGVYFDVVSIPFERNARLVLLVAGFLANIEFVFRFLQRPMSNLFRWIEVAYLLFSLVIWRGVNGWSAVLFQIVVLLWLLPVEIGPPLLLFLGYREGRKEAGILILPTLLAGLAVLYPSFHYLLFLCWPRLALPQLPYIHLGPMFLSMDMCFLFLTWLAFGFILISRSTAITRERERISGEIQAAKAVQDVLMPKLLSGTPGFTLDSVYLPAQEVGGDFFHVSPAPDGSLRLVIGDVSGKGLKAAMMVSLIIGALDREPSRDPAGVLTGLNRMLTLHTTGGFTTCLCLNISPTGLLTAANAGHFAPYHNGLEHPMQGNLPLGLDPDAEYTETSTHILPGDHLLLFSDGIPEARSPRGELYGFDRTAAIIARHASAQTIAAEAQAFGQEDDITVLELTLLSS
jgi:sigma-B regulation protein RsbU (phosphoserine phosphatase)